MSPAEIDDFVGSERRVVVVGVKQGAPIATIGSAEVVGEHRWMLTVPADDEVAEVLAADDRVCILVERFPSYYEIRGVVARGRARPRGLQGRSFGFELEPDHIASFDFAKLPREGPGSGRTLS
jgi:hypothetical protein